MFARPHPSCPAAHAPPPQITAIIDADEKAKRMRGGIATEGAESSLAKFGGSDPELVDEVLSLKKQVEQLKEMVTGKKAGGGGGH